MCGIIRLVWGGVGDDDVWGGLPQIRAGQWRVALIATADVESIVQSQLNVSLLDIFVDDADAEITGQFGRHPTDAADPATSPCPCRTARRSH